MAKKPVPLDRMAKPQLLKAAQAMQKRIAKLEAAKAAINNPEPLAYVADEDKPISVGPDDEPALMQWPSPWSVK